MDGLRRELAWYAGETAGGRGRNPTRVHTSTSMTICLPRAVTAATTLGKRET